MGTRLFIVDKPGGGGYRLPSGATVERARDLPVGAMWRMSRDDEPGWLIMLPDHQMWCTLDVDEDQHIRWTVTGEPPNLTVEPSIDGGPGRWHGRIVNGEFDHD